MSNPDLTPQDAAANPDQVNDKSGEHLYQTWTTEIFQALKREKTYRKEGKMCVELFEARRPQSVPFNILYSNTETLSPAVYNARPVPIVDRRFKDEDPVGKLAAETGTRILKYLIEAESEEYDNFDELVQAAVLGALLASRGVTRIKYVARTTDESVEAECVYGEDVRWNKFFHGYARSWKKVPWIGFEWDMTRKEIRQNFGDEIANQISIPDFTDSGEEDANSDPELRQERVGVNLCRVWEIWNKADRKVYFFSDSWPKGAMKTVDDPLELESFFPVPKPLNFLRKMSTMVPTPLYMEYQQQAQELNDITRRLKFIIKALRVRGFYNSTIEGMDKVLNSDDNVLTPVENMASMPEGMAADKMIWLMPLQELVGVAQSLYQQREQCKQVIYEITGVSDILRGASVASETATAQNIKNQWGTLRLKRFQKEVQRYCRDLLRLMLEVAVTRFDVSTVQQMTGLPFPTQQQKQMATQQIQMMQMQASQQAQQMAVQAQMSGQPAPPPQPPQIPPQVQAAASTPSWTEILDLLKNDIQRSYRVDIETNSTVDTEATQDKQDIADLLNALSQFLNGLAPLVENGTMPFEVAKQILLTISRRYTFGPQLEDALEKMQAPPKQDGPSPEDQAKLQVVQEQAKADSAKAQADMQKTQLDMKYAEQKAQIEMAIMQEEFRIKQEELKLKAIELQMQAAQGQQKMELSQHQHRLKMQQAEETAAQKKQQAKEKEPA